MSYPAGPPNPYSQPPRQPPQPPSPPQYGYPQQGFPPQPQPSPYGYPAQPPAPPAAAPGWSGYSAYPAYPGQPGYPLPGVPGAMSPTLAAARVVLFVLAGLYGVLGLFVMVAVDSIGTAAGSASLSAFGVVFGLLLMGVGGLLITLGARFTRGRGGVRGSTIAVAVLTIIGGFGDIARHTMPATLIIGLLLLAAGIFLLVAMVRAEATQWFGRPRY